MSRPRNRRRRTPNRVRQATAAALLTREPMTEAMVARSQRDQYFVAPDNGLLGPVLSEQARVHVLDAARSLDPARLCVVVGHGAAQVRAALSAPDVSFATQERQLGTGHAVMQALPSLLPGGTVLVLYGDVPLIAPATLRALVEAASGGALALLTQVVEEPAGYGRIVRNNHGCFDAIVEHRNCTPQQLAIREIYPSYACFDAKLLFEMLGHLKPNESIGEYYLTDVFGMLKERGYRVEIIDAVPPEDVLSINTPQQLAEVDAILRIRLNMPARRQTAEART